MIVTDARSEHVPALLARMGQARVKWLADRAQGDAALRIDESIRLSAITWCGQDEAGPVMFGGVIPQKDGSGYVWQIIAGVERNKRAYLTASRVLIDEGLRYFSRLVTVIEAEYRAALRHVRRNGWAIGAPEMIEGILAHRCERTR